MFGQPLNVISVGTDGKQRHTRNFSDATLQILIVGGNDKNSPLFDSIDDAVICIGSFVITLKAFEPRVFCQLQSHAVLPAKFFQFGNYTVSDIRNA